MVSSRHHPLCCQSQRIPRIVDLDADVADEADRATATLPNPRSPASVSTRDELWRAPSSRVSPTRSSSNKKTFSQKRRCALVELGPVRRRRRRRGVRAPCRRDRRRCDSRDRSRTGNCRRRRPASETRAWFSIDSLFFLLCDYTVRFFRYPHWNDREFQRALESTCPRGRLSTTLSVAHLSRAQTLSLHPLSHTSRRLLTI